MPIQGERLIKIWLTAICGMIIGMIVLGGITRLTRAGLSIVEWKPVLGVLPPLNAREWDEAFRDYQRHPEYRLVNHGMTLAEFKFIYFWEYLHRLVGRLIGLMIFVPGAIFIFQRRIRMQMALRLGGGLFLIGAQGALGWYMVRSGLVDRPYVSHYRLAAHLGLALVTLGYFFCLVLGLQYPKASASRDAKDRSFRFLVRSITGLIAVQIFYGALTAGLKAGFGYNTFPKMNGRWMPPDPWILSPVWRNLFENAATVQFIHRTLAWGLLTSTFTLWICARRRGLAPLQRFGTNAVFIAVVTQFMLGVLTLLLIVPIPVAAIHQLGACVVFLCAVLLNHSLRPIDPKCVQSRSLRNMKEHRIAETV